MIRRRKCVLAVAVVVSLAGVLGLAVRPGADPGSTLRVDPTRRTKTASRPVPPAGGSPVASRTKPARRQVVPRPAQANSTPPAPRPASSVAFDPSDRAGLIETIRSTPDDRTRQWAIFHLVNGHGIGPEETLVLLGVLDGCRSPDALSTALWGLSRSEERSVAPAVTRFAETSPYPEARTEAVRTLAALDDEVSSVALARIVREDPDDGVRAQSALLMGLTRGQRAVETLERAAASDRSPTVRSAAVDGLGAVGGEAALAALERLAHGCPEAGERSRARRLLETARQIAAAGTADLTLLLAEPVQPATAQVEPSHQ